TKYRGGGRIVETAFQFVFEEQSIENILSSRNREFADVVFHNRIFPANGLRLFLGHKSPLFRWRSHRIRCHRKSDSDASRVHSQSEFPIRRNHCNRYSPKQSFRVQSCVSPCCCILPLGNL